MANPQAEQKAPELFDENFNEESWDAVTQAVKTVLRGKHVVTDADERCAAFAGLRPMTNAQLVTDSAEPWH